MSGRGTARPSDWPTREGQPSTYARTPVRGVRTSTHKRKCSAPERSAASKEATLCLRQNPTRS